MKWIDGQTHVGIGTLISLSPQELLDEMDKNGIERAVIVPPDWCIAVDNAEGNDMIIALAEKYDRFIPFCGVNPWYGNRAIEELKKSSARGVKGVRLDPALGGYYLADLHVLPVVECAVKLGMIIYVPTGIPALSLPMQLTNLAEKYPEGIFIEGRFGYPDFWIDAVPSMINTPNIYADISYNMPSTIENAVKVLGAERLIFCSDAPYLSVTCEIDKLMNTHITEHERELIGRKNILRLLGEEA